MMMAVLVVVPVLVVVAFSVRVVAEWTAACFGSRGVDWARGWVENICLSACRFAFLPACLPACLPAFLPFCLFAFLTF